MALTFSAPAFRGAREHRGLSQETLARLADVSTGVIANAENARTVPSAETLATIAVILGVPIETFFGGQR